MITVTIIALPFLIPSPSVCGACRLQPPLPPPSLTLPSRYCTVQRREPSDALTDRPLRG